MVDRADAIVAAIKRPGRGQFLQDLFEWADITDPFPSPQARAQASLTSPGRHLVLHTAQVVVSATQHPWDDIVLEQAVFGAEAELPFSLDAATETPDSARTKLATHDTVGGDAAMVARGDRRMSFFLFDATVIELTFKPGMTGLSQVMAARLGA